MVQFQPGPPVEKSVDWVDAIPWTVAAIGILVSLGWNFFNYTRTTAIQRDLRQQQIRLEEFRRLRDALDDDVEALGLRTKELKVAAATAKSLNVLRSSTLAPEKAVSEAYVELQDQLIATDLSAYANGDDWLGTVEPHWETYADRIFLFREARDAATARVELEAAAGAIASLRHSLNQRLDREVEQYANHQKTSRWKLWRS